MRKLYLALAGATAALTLATLVIVGNGKATDTAAQEATVVPTTAYVPTAEYPDERVPPETQIAPGIPAIQPNVAAVPGMATFTVQDVVAYLTVFPPLYWDASTPLPVVEEFEILTARQVGERLQTTIFRPEDELVVLIRLRGNFTVWGPPVPGRDGPAYVGDTQYLVFGSQNGNLLKIVMGD